MMMAPKIDFERVDMWLTDGQNKVETPVEETNESQRKKPLKNGL
jgi:hypothetical protein